MRLRRLRGGRRTLAVGAVLLVVAGMLAATAQANSGRPHYRLTVLHNNDGESKITAAGSGALAQYGGMARFATVVDKLRAEALADPDGKGEAPRRGVVMLSSGDNFLAGAEFNASLTKGVPFYDSIGLSLIGYDAIAIGNHEFDFGPDTLADFISGFSGRTAFLSSNLDFTAEPRLQALVDEGRFCVGNGARCGPHVAGSTIVWEAGEKIGIVGATTPALPFISSPRGVKVST